MRRDLLIGRMNMVVVLDGWMYFSAMFIVSLCYALIEIQMVRVRQTSQL